MLDFQKYHFYRASKNLTNVFFFWFLLYRHLKHNNLLGKMGDTPVLGLDCEQNTSKIPDKGEDIIENQDNDSSLATNHSVGVPPTHSDNNLTYEFKWNQRKIHCSLCSEVSTCLRSYCKHIFSFHRSKVSKNPPT